MQQTENRQNNPKNGEDPAKITIPEQGRQAGSAQPAASESEGDISQIDQQEGQMNNGELGGNFNDAKDNAGGA